MSSLKLTSAMLEHKLGLHFSYICLSKTRSLSFSRHHLVFHTRAALVIDNCIVFETMQHLTKKVLRNVCESMEFSDVVITKTYNYEPPIRYCYGIPEVEYTKFIHDLLLYSLEHKYIVDRLRCLTEAAEEKGYLYKGHDTTHAYKSKIYVSSNDCLCPIEYINGKYYAKQ